MLIIYFLDPGSHLINLEVINIYGCVNTTSKNIVINDNPKVDLFVSIIAKKLVIHLLIYHQ